MVNIVRNNKIKIVWVTHIVNSYFNDNLPLQISLQDILKCFLKGTKLSSKPCELAIWNTNAIYELKKYTDIFEFHVISPYPYLKKQLYEFNDGKLYYHFFRSNVNIKDRIFHRINNDRNKYQQNSNIINEIISKIDPDIVEIIGIENPYYASCASEIDKKYTVLVHLQTLINDPKFEKNYPISHRNYMEIATCEKKALLRANYICTNVDYFKKIINREIKPDAKFLTKRLVLGEKINMNPTIKTYDFVYFSTNIAKAGDYAIEAFIEASKLHKGITLDIIGFCDNNFKKQIEKRLIVNDLLDNVTFEGRLVSHDDVIKQIRKSKFALLPLKIDLVSGTIRESLANGLPVVTTITPATPNLNIKRDTVLISPPGDFKAMALNMCKLLDDDRLANTLRTNGSLYMSENFSNSAIVEEWISTYSFVYNNSINNNNAN